MIAIILIGGLLFVFLLFGYLFWLDSPRSAGYRQSPLGYLAHLFDFLLGFAAALATSVLVESFGEHGKDTPAFVFWLFRTAVSVLGIGAIVVALLKPVRGLGPKLAAYACVLVPTALIFFWLGFDIPPKGH
jgi:hypothetical protein